MRRGLARRHVGCERPLPEGVVACRDDRRLVRRNIQRHQASKARPAAINHDERLHARTERAERVHATCNHTHAHAHAACHVHVSSHQHSARTVLVSAPRDGVRAPALRPCTSEETVVTLTCCVDNAEGQPAPPPVVTGRGGASCVCARPTAPRGRADRRLLAFCGPDIYSQRGGSCSCLLEKRLLEIRRHH